MKLLIIFTLSILVLSPAMAQTSFDAGGPNGGSIIVGTDARACDGTIAGAIRYNSSQSCVEFCNGTDWTCPNSGLSGPADCPNIGDVCTAQGNIVFAGYHPLTHEHLFIPTSDQGSLLWKNNDGDIDITSPSLDNGEYNQNNLNYPISNYPAFNACENLNIATHLGHTDWYLPSQIETFYLWTVHEVIEGAGNISNFSNSSYWSSTEFNDSNAVYQFFVSIGAMQGSNKSGGTRGVRCVRR